MPESTPRLLVAAGLALAATGVLALSRGHASGSPAGAPVGVVAAPAGAPVRVDIPAIGVSAAVDPLGLRADGTVQVPGRFDRVGWYAGSAVPGAPGPAVLLGHVDSTTGPAVFYGLSRLRPGDEVVVDRGDVAVAHFLVDRVAEVRKSAFPTADVYGPTAGPTLRLVTCAGPFHGRYRDNLVVFAHLAP